MKAFKYKVKIFDSVLDYTHGLSYEIVEFFIPQKEIGFNISTYGELFVFREREPRNDRDDVEKIELDDSLVASLEEYVDLKEHLKEEVSKLYV